MKSLLLSIFLFSSINNRLLSGLPYQHGTYIIAGICRSGILLFSDSRVVIPDVTGKIGAYFDDAPKLYRLGNIVFGMAGRTTFSKIYFQEIFNEFAHSHKEEIPIHIFVSTLLRFAKSKMPNADYELLENNQFLVCGYSGSYPAIYWHWKNNDESFSEIGDFKSNNEMDNTNKGELTPIF